jgi:hypothetical protein
MNFSPLRPAGHSLARVMQRRTSPLAATMLARWYGATKGIPREQIEERVLHVVRAFEGVDPEKVC